MVLSEPLPKAAPATDPHSLPEAIARQRASREGIFAGMSSGAAGVGALRIAAEMSSGTIVVWLPVRGDRYLSAALFRSVCANCRP